MSSWSDIEIRETAEQAIHTAQAELAKANKANAVLGLLPRASDLGPFAGSTTMLTIDRPPAHPIMDTPANRAAMPKADYKAWPKVEEVAVTILFLASPENKVTRGAVVPVYGQS